MGYTIYWKNHAASKETIDKTISMIKDVIDYRHKIELTEHGFRFDGGHETFAYNTHREHGGCGTKRRFPYTEDIMKALIVMVEMGLAENPHHDDELEDFLKPLEEVSEVILLKTYEKQKNYFSSELPSERHIGS